MRKIGIGALAGLVTAVALIEIPSWLSDSDRYEIGDSYVGMMPIGLLLGLAGGLVWHVIDRDRRRPPR